jgi:hypothetical protein
MTPIYTRKMYLSSQLDNVGKGVTKIGRALLLCEQNAILFGEHLVKDHFHHRDDRDA